MKRAVISAAIAASLGLAGCVSPLVQPSLPTAQPKIAHAVNVKQFAQAAATRFALRVKTSDKPSLFVAPGPADMPFATTFKAYLEEAFIAQGFTVSQTAMGAEVVNFETQPFLYGSDRQKHLVEYASFWTTWANIGYHLGKSEGLGSAMTAAAFIGPVLDVLDAMDQSTPAEVMVRVSVVDANRVFYSDSRTFYIPPADLPLYMSALPKTAPQMMADEPGGLPVVPLRISSGY